MTNEFGKILLFIIAAVSLLSVMLLVAKWLRPNRPNAEKLSTYESGEEPIGNANVAINPRFYVVALIFVLFEVELLFLFPWATVFGQKDLMLQTKGAWGWFATLEMIIFVALLAVGLAYAWAKGYLDWVKPKPTIPTTQSHVPADMYERINDKYK